MDAHGRIDSGLLAVGDGHRVYWEVYGSAAGTPAVVLHGGPGSGCAPWWRELFDPRRFSVVLFDQRGCGRSRPHAGRTPAGLEANTTRHLLADIERLRAHVGVERWLVVGASWGSTLALAYAERHPERVRAMVLFSVAITARRDVDWVTRHCGRFFPEEWERFRDAVPPEDRDGDLVDAYARLLADPDPAVHEPAARAWCAWEDRHVRTRPDQPPDPRYDDPIFRLCFARLVTYYWRNAGFLEEGALMRDLHRLQDIPAVLVHGRLDLSSPLDGPWLLARSWPKSRLVVIDDEGHTGGSATMDAVKAAIAGFHG